MYLLPILLAGYSIFCAVAIALTHFRGEAYRGQATARIAGLVLLGALALLQIAHVAWLHANEPWPDSLAYRLSLYTIAPCFYLYSRSLLRARAATSFHAQDLAHVAPVLLAPLLPGSLAQPLAFLIGAGYLLWLGRQLLVLRAERARFHVEVVLLGFTLDEIRVLLPNDQARWQHDELLAGLERKVAEIEILQQRLEQNKAQLLLAIDGVKNRPDALVCTDRAQWVLAKLKERNGSATLQRTKQRGRKA